MNSDPSDELPDVVRSAAALLITHSNHGWKSLLAEHIPDRTGHCRLCQNLTWPCTLWTIARHAKALAERR
jgi:hypothetical protein